jgi:hypothetical protein
MRKIAIACGLALVLVACLLTGCGKAQPVVEIVDVCNFCIHDPDVSNSLAKGAVFAKTIDSSRHVVISAWIEIEPEDWGGAEFTISPGWEIADVTSSYIDTLVGGKPNEYIARFTTSSPEEEWRKRVEIACRPIMPRPDLGGGSGSVIIELEPEEPDNPPRECKILIGVGSEERDGVLVMHPVGDIVTVYFPETAES